MRLIGHKLRQFTGSVISVLRFSDLGHYVFRGIHLILIPYETFYLTGVSTC